MSRAQVEVNRSLYMVEATRERLPEGFERLRGDLGAISAALAEEVRSRRPHRQQAPEAC